MIFEAGFIVHESLPIFSLLNIFDNAFANGSFKDIFSSLSIFFKSKINGSFSEAAPAYMQAIAAYMRPDIAAYSAPFCDISKLSFFWLIVLQKFLQLYGLGIQLLKHFFIVAISHSA